MGDGRPLRRPEMNADHEPTEDAIFTLHRYFIWANKLREHLEETLRQQGPMPDTHPRMTDSERESTEQAARQWLLPVFFYGSYWLASLYVVLEGWQALQLQDAKVDRLMDREFVDLLRRHRNAILHYQPQYLDRRVEALVIDSAGTRAGHAREVHDALSEYFLRWFDR